MMAFDMPLRLRRYVSRLQTVADVLALRLIAAGHSLPWLDRMLRRLYPPEVRLRHEFNRWAEKGLGAGMERDHLRFTERVLDTMNLSAVDRVLDLACGEGWACRLMAARLGRSGRVVGLDVSDEMVRLARTKSASFEQVTFLCGSAERIPCLDGCFTKVLSVASFIVFEHQEQVLDELFRVLAPEGELFILTYLYKDHPEWVRLAREIAWEARTGMSLRVCSAAEYKSMLKARAWGDVRTDEWLSDNRSGSEADGHDRALLIRARKTSLGLSS
jgi:SAM-dependent methyltransferase